MRSVLLLALLLIVFCKANSQQWQDVTPTSYTDAFFSSMSFINEKEGWAFARPVPFGNFDLIHTSDGAQTFEKLFTLTENMTCWRFQMVDSLYGYAKTENSFLKTIDGGHSWQDISDTALFNIGNPLWSSNGFYFTDRNTGLYGGLNSIYKTLDGGLSFQKMNTPQIIDSTAPERRYQVNAIYFTDSQYGWAACHLFWDGGCGMKTVDGGESWAVCIPATGYLSYLHFANNQTGGMGGTATFSYELFLTNNNFFTPPAYVSTWPQFATSICYQNDITLWYGASPPVFNRSTDGGLTFEKYDTTYATTHANESIMDIDFFGNTGYAIANSALLKLADTLTTASTFLPESQPVIILSPNPASKVCTAKITVQQPACTSFDLFTIAGISAVKSEKFLSAGTNEIPLDLSDLKPGIYILKVSSPNYSITKKLVVK